MPGSGSTRRARPTGNAALSGTDASIPTSTPTTRAGATPSTLPAVRSVEDSAEGAARLVVAGEAGDGPTEHLGGHQQAGQRGHDGGHLQRAGFHRDRLSHRCQVVLEGDRHEPVVGVDLLQRGLGFGQPARVDPELGRLHHVSDVGAVGLLEARQQPQRREPGVGQVVGKAHHGGDVGVDGGAGEACLVGEHRIVLRPLRDVRRCHRAETDGAPDADAASPPSAR